MIKSPDIAGFLSGLFAIVAAIPPLYWTIFEREVKTSVSERVFIAFYLSDEDEQSGYLSIIAPISYYSLMIPERISTIIHEKVKVTFHKGGQTRNYLLRWQHFVEGGQTFIDSSKKPKIKRIYDAEPFAFNGQAVKTHSTMFAPRTEHCIDTVCDTKWNYITREEAQGFVPEADRISMVFLSTAFPNIPIRYECDVLIEDKVRKSFRRKLKRGDNVIEIPGRCLAPSKVEYEAFFDAYAAMGPGEHFG